MMSGVNIISYLIDLRDWGRDAPLDGVQSVHPSDAPLEAGYQVQHSQLNRLKLSRSANDNPNNRV